MSRANRLTGAGVVMDETLSGNAFWVMWLGPRQWEGLPGFGVGQPGRVCAVDEPAGVFIFYPVFGSESAWSYQVSGVTKDFLRFSTLEHA